MSRQALARPTVVHCKPKEPASASQDCMQQESDQLLWQLRTAGTHKPQLTHCDSLGQHQGKCCRLWGACTPQLSAQGACAAPCILSGAATKGASSTAGDVHKAMRAGAGYTAGNRTAKPPPGRYFLVSIWLLGTAWGSAALRDCSVPAIGRPSGSRPSCFRTHAWSWGWEGLEWNGMEWNGLEWNGKRAFRRKGWGL